MYPTKTQSPQEKMK